MLNPGSKPIGAVVISSATFCCKYTHLFPNNKQNMKKNVPKVLICTDLNVAP